jgi:hypothetical protein
MTAVQTASAAVSMARPSGDKGIHEAVAVVDGVL